MSEKIKSYEFEESGGQQIVDGKVYYPHFLHIAFKDKNHALELAETIIRLVRSDRENETDVYLTLWGKLTETDE